MNIKEALRHEWFHKFDDTNIISARRISRENKSKDFELFTNTEKLKKNL